MASVALKQAWLDPRSITAEAREKIARRARAEQCRRSLYEFVKESFSELEPGTEPQWNWHIEAFCFHVQNMLEGWLVANGHGTPAMRDRVVGYWASHGLTYVQGYLLVQNLIMNLPPITLKSRILMVCAPAWMWLHCPSWTLCAISSVDDNVERDSNMHRELVQSEWYKTTFEIGWKIKDGSKDKKKRGPANENASKTVKSDSVKKWATTAGGERKSRTMLGGFTGVHVDAIFLDDPDDAHKVFSEPKRREVQDKWRRAIKNRVKHPDRSIRIAIQQRVHSDDWTAAQVANGVWSPDDRMAWAWVVIPLQYGRGPDEAPKMSPWFWTDPRRVANDNLQPSRFSDEFIADEIRDKGPEGFEGQYNQNPASFEDGMIKRSYVRFFRVEDEPVTTRTRPLGCGVDQVSGAPTPTRVIRRLDDGSLDLDWLTITVDCSNGSEAVTASQVGILCVGGKELERFIFDDRTAIMGIEAMYDAVAACVQAWPVGRVLIELKAAGPSVINDLTKRLKRGDITHPDGSPKLVVVEAIKVESGDSKESRAAAMVSAWALGLVHVLEGAAWLYPRMTASGKLLDEGFIGEVCTFPRSRKNDRVDALSQLMAFYSKNGDAKTKAKAYATLARMMGR